MSTTPNMGLPTPEPGVTPAPTWGVQQQEAMGLIDKHRHTPGEGERVPTAGLNINDPLNMQGYPAYNQDSVQFVPRASPPDWSPATDSKRSVYTLSDGELYFKDGSGRIVKITNHGQVNGAGGGTGGISYFLTAANVTALRQVISSTIQPYQVYKTLAYSTVLGRGGGFYLWDPTEIGVDDGALIIRPLDATTGAFVWLPPDGETFDSHASPLDFTGQTDESQRLWDLLWACRNRGITQFLGHDGDVDIRTFNNYSGLPAYAGLNGIKFKGRGVDQTRFRARVQHNALLTDVRLIASSALPACTAAGAGAGKTLTMNAIGGLGVDNLSLGNIIAVGASSITLAIAANAGLVAPGDVVQYGVNDVGGSVVLNSNPGTGVVNFTLPHGGVVTPGMGAWKAKLLSPGQRCLVAGQANGIDNGIYTYSLSGVNARLTRATDFDASAAMAPRLGVRATDGNANIRAIFVLSNKANQFYDSTPMIMDASVQYWTLEPYVSGALDFRTLFEVPIYRQSRPSYSAQHFNQWLRVGESVLTDVNFLGGGAWTDPDSGIAYNLKAVEPGDQWFLKIGGTPTDQGWYYDGFKCHVRSVDGPNRRVTLDRGARLTTVCSQKNISLGTCTAVGANTFTLGAATNNADLADVGSSIIVNGRGTVTTVTAKDPTTGVVNVAALPVGSTAGDEIWTIPVAPVSLGTIAAVGVNQITLTVAANAGLCAKHDRLWVAGRLCANYGGVNGFAIVDTVDAATGVITFIAATMPPATTIGDTCYQVVHFPWFDENFARDNLHNEYHRVIRDCARLEFSDFTCDGVSINLDYCSDIDFHDFVVRNVHIGINVAGTTGFIRRYRIENHNGYPFPGITDPTNPLCWYGWAHQSNYNPGLEIESPRGDGISGDWADQEAETRTRWRNVHVTLRQSPVAHNSQFLGGTTPHVLKHNPVDGMIVDGGFSNTYTLVLSDPVHNLTFSAQWPTFNVPSVSLDLNTTSGILEFKGRRYDLSFRRHWRTMVILTPSMTKTITRPFQGLWSNTRIMFNMPSILGLTSFAISPDFVTQTDLISIITNDYRQNAWINPGADGMNFTYPNCGDNEKQVITIQTSGAFPVGAFACWIETDIVPEINRGDGYSGVTNLTDARLYKSIPDVSNPFQLYAAGVPASTPLWPGQRYINSATGDIYEAIDVTGAGDWKKIT